MTELLPWIWFNLFIVAMLLLDLFVFHKKSHEISIKEALYWTFFWIALALGFNGYLYYTQGEEVAVSFFTGYLIEKTLSVDNLFVFLLMFRYFCTPPHLLHKVLFWGVLGAIIMRALFIWLGIELISNFHWMIYLFGIFLIFTGIKFAFEEEKEVDPMKNPVIRIIRYFTPVSDKYDDGKFFTRLNGRLMATPLFIVLIAIETTDVIFAVDSIPAILAITHDPFIVYTSNIFAILGLRSLYFVLSHMMTLFHFLNYGLSFILVFIGLKMIASDFIKIPNFIALLVIALALTITVILSLVYKKKKC